MTARKYTPKQLDSLLVPVFLQGLSQSSQASILAGNSAQAVDFRKKAMLVLTAAKKAFSARSRGTCSANFVVPYTVGNSTVVVCWRSMADYYIHLQGAPVAGFPFLLSKTVPA
jgi:hypothetical protein